MPRRRLKAEDIESTYREVLEKDPSATVRGLRAELRRRYGASGRTARLLASIRVVRQTAARITDPLSQDEEVARLRREVELAEGRAAQAEESMRLAVQRAVQAEERETGNQDFFAKRYQEQLAQMEAQRAAQPRGVPVEEYLRVYRRAAYYRDRLSLYEKVEQLDEVGVYLPK